MIIISDSDLRQIGEGTHDSIYEKLGAHALDLDGSSGTHFGVWAPHAREVSVIGDFNGWNPAVNPLERRGRTGVWSGFVPAIGQGASTNSRWSPPTAPRGWTGPTLTPSPPSPPPGPPRKSGTRHSTSGATVRGWPAVATVNRSPRRSRSTRCTLAPGCVFPSRETGSRPTVKPPARLAKYAAEMGFTHVDPTHAHLRTSGRGVLGLPAVTSMPPRLGSARPMTSCSSSTRCTRQGIGVILDWVPAHFAPDRLAKFDGAHLRARRPQKAEDPGLGNIRLQLRAPPVVNFLTANALFWLEKYHFDGLRVNGWKR